jgi:3-isopropylmalate dehydrogenase
MTKNILVLAGDGIGPEVVDEAKKVLQKIEQKYNHIFNFENELIGHASIQVHGTSLTNEVVEKAKKSDAVLLGAVGHPMYDNDPSAKVRPEQGLLKIRQELGLFANIRPVKIFDTLLDSSPLKPEIIKGTDIVFFRELTGGIYFGKPRERSADGERAIDTMVYTKSEIRRIAIKAFEASMNRNKKVMSVDKANVLECSRLWREVVNEVAKDYPEVELSHQFIDSATMKLLTNPRDYDVILTANLFGDILTDEASQIVGSMGLLASASVGQEVGLYEPIHGSAPDIAGQGIANPIATILSVSLMLEMAFGLKDEAENINQAVAKVLKSGYRTKDLDKTNFVSTSEMGDLVCEKL